MSSSQTRKETAREYALEFNLRAKKEFDRLAQMPVLTLAVVMKSSAAHAAHRG